MLSDQYKRELAQLVKDAGKIRAEIGAEEARAGKACREASQMRASARRSSSQSTRDMYSRQAEAEDTKVAAAEKKIGALQEKLSANLALQQSKKQSLYNAERNRLIRSRSSRIASPRPK